MIQPELLVRWIMDGVRNMKPGGYAYARHRAVAAVVACKSRVQITRFVYDMILYADATPFLINCINEGN